MPNSTFWFVLLDFDIILSLIDSLAFNLPPSNHLLGPLKGVSAPNHTRVGCTCLSSSPLSLVSFCLPLEAHCSET